MAVVNTPSSETSESSCEPRTLAAGLYIVATPIGNLGDVTMRAVDVLRNVSLIACEDTRVTGKLLKACGAPTRMQRYDDHSSIAIRENLIERARNEPVALVSDAGTPLISDPGYKLVREAREAGLAVTTIPGPCAAIAGLTLSGLPNDRFMFAGFLPVKEKPRSDLLTELGDVQATLVFYETGPRLTRSLAALAEIWPTRCVSVARELTKLHEECRTGTAMELRAHYDSHPPKGEIVLLVGPPVVNETETNPDALLKEALTELSASKAAGKVAKATGIDRQTLYTRAVELKQR
ncbi:MAG: 16S rRNA (cytidine(1402)-2'-O)-methyltransferase [Pseudomonadota bacterium]